MTFFVYNFLFRNGTSKMTCLQDQEEFLSSEVNSEQEITLNSLFYMLVSSY